MIASNIVGYSAKVAVFFLIILVLLVSMPSFKILASSSTDYKIDSQIETNSSGADSNSANFSLKCQQLGDLAVGESTDNNGVKIQHGLQCDDTATATLDLIFSPQGRYGAVLSNDQTKVTIEIRPVGGNAGSFIFSQTVTTLADGSYSGLSLNAVPPGTYDITAKGWASLRVKKTIISIISGLNSIDFTDAGSNRAKVGDVDISNRFGVGSAEEGDNEISAADYSVLVGNYNLSGPAYDKINLDQYDSSASAADYSILVSNYNLTGVN